MNKFFAALTMVAFVSLAFTGVAQEACTPVTENPEYDSDRDTPGAWAAAHDAAGSPSELGSRDRQFYLDNDACQAELCGFSIWIYEESNGREGLQRNDDFAGDRTCGLYPADTIIF